MRKKLLCILSAILLLCLLTSACTDAGIPGSGSGAGNSSDSQSAGAVGSPDSQNGNSSCYDVSVPVKSAEDVLSVTPISIPDALSDLSWAVCGLMNDHTLLLKRYDSAATDLSQRELGLYDWEADRYTCLIDDAELVNQLEVVFIRQDYIVLRFYENTPDQMALTKMSLALLNLEDNSLEYFFDYWEDPNTHLVYENANSIYGTEQYVYFDDISLDEDGVLRADLYQYDLESNEVSLIWGNAQNPMPYQDSIIVVTQGADGSYNQISDLFGNVISDIQVHLVNFGLASGGESIYCIENAYTSEEEAYTIYQLTNLLTGQAVLSTREPISHVAVTEDFVAWRNYTNELPYLYDAANGALLRFDMAREGRNNFCLAQGCGILQSSRGYDAPELYFFRR